MVRRKSCLKKEESSTVLTTEDKSESMNDDVAAASKKKDRDGDKREVCFGDLIIYEFPNLLGDNPGVSEGAPLTIGWKHENKNVVAVDYYEFLRSSRPRRKRKELVIPSAARDTFLLGMGYKLDDIVSAAEETKKIRKSRQASMKGSSWDRFKRVFDKKNKGKEAKSVVAAASPKIVAAKSG